MNVFRCPGRETNAHCSFDNNHRPPGDVDSPGHHCEKFFSRPRSTDATNTTAGMDNWQTWGRRKSQPTPRSYLSYLRLVDRRIVLDRIMVPNGTRRTAHMHMHHPSSTVPSPSHLPCCRYRYRCVALRCLGEASPVMWTSSPALSNTGGGGKGLACLIFTHLPAPHPWNICNSF